MVFVSLFGVPFDDETFHFLDGKKLFSRMKKYAVNYAQKEGRLDGRRVEDKLLVRWIHDHLKMAHPLDATAKQAIFSLRDATKNNFSLIHEKFFLALAALAHSAKAEAEQSARAANIAAAADEFDDRETDGLSSSQGSLSEGTPETTVDGGLQSRDQQLAELNRKLAEKSSELLELRLALDASLTRPRGLESGLPTPMAMEDADGTPGSARVAGATPSGAGAAPGNLTRGPLTWGEPPVRPSGQPMPDPKSTPSAMTNSDRVPKGRQAAGGSDDLSYTDNLDLSTLMRVAQSSPIHNRFERELIDAVSTTGNMPPGLAARVTARWRELGCDRSYVEPDQMLAKAHKAFLGASKVICRLPGGTPLATTAARYASLSASAFSQRDALYMLLVNEQLALAADDDMADWFINGATANRFTEMWATAGIDFLAESIRTNNTERAGLLVDESTRAILKERLKEDSMYNDESLLSGLQEAHKWHKYTKTTPAPRQQQSQSQSSDTRSHSRRQNSGRRNNGNNRGGGGSGGGGGNGGGGAPRGAQGYRGGDDARRNNNYGDRSRGNSRERDRSRSPNPRPRNDKTSLAGGNKNNYNSSSGRDNYSNKAPHRGGNQA